MKKMIMMIMMKIKVKKKKEKTYQIILFFIFFIFFIFYLEKEPEKTNLKKIPNEKVVDNSNSNNNNKEKEKEENFFTSTKSKIIIGASIFALKIKELFQNKNEKNSEENFQFSKIDFRNSYIPLSIILVSLLLIFIIWKFLIKSKSKNLPKNEENKFNKNSNSKNKEITLPNKDLQDINVNKEINSDENVIVLKGRTKKIPRSLNYNELFVNNISEKQEFNKANSTNHKKAIAPKNNSNFIENQEKEEEKNTNFEDFFDKINENKQVLEIINQAKNVDN